MSNFGDDLIAAMSQATAYATGLSEVARAHTLEVPDVRSIRDGLGLSQQAFASLYLSVIAGMPEAARDVFRSIV